MAGYNELHGLRVKYLSEDPSNGEDGQVWYNSTSGNLRVQGIASTGWITTATMITNRNSSGFCGTVSAALQFGGTGFTAVTEEYNGIGWSAGGNLGAGRYGLGSTGTQTAGLAIGGYSPSVSYSNSTEKYDGSSWTTSGNLGTPNWQHNGVGTQTATIAYGGYSDAAGGFNALSETFNGSTWTSTPSLNTGRMGLAGAGTSTAALGWCGQNPGATQLTEAWDGSSWTTAPNTNEPAGGTNTGAGTQTAALAFGLGSGTVHTELYDGTSWTNATDSPGAIAQGEGGSQTSAVGTQAPFGTQEYTADTTTTITAAAWASGGTLPSPGRQGYGVGTGTQTASIIAGGPPDSTQNQFYDGASWTSLASIPSGVTNSQGFGDSEELLMAGGNTGSPYSALTYVYSRPGNSWTAVSSPGNINTARALGAGCGALSTAGIIAGGDTPSYTTATENWNGSAWTTVNALPTATGNGVGSCGTQTAGLAFSGQNPGDSTAEETYEWDGTNWTSGGNRSTGVRAVRGGAGTQTAALTFGGWLDPGGSVSTEGYDGTSWSTRPNMAGSAANNFQTGTQTAALRAGGTDGPGYTAVEEFTGETISNNVNNLVVS